MVAWGGAAVLGAATSLFSAFDLVSVDAPLRPVFFRATLLMSRPKGPGADGPGADDCAGGGFFTGSCAAGAAFFIPPIGGGGGGGGGGGAPPMVEGISTGASKAAPVSD